ncbi:hypothetical protein B0J11DRAFT_598539 [Dendryphion nanum]|uniref:Uncharacterized protein n=1 Tax=Dendryphion nanum TaxID=256645 RepID=A0A9P9I9U6_9PLEO|nr:hypothetical protein B0J11DRAFT_598539 [Dendryphion nanum]
MGNLPLIQNVILSNNMNAATIGLIWSNGAELAKFLVDFVEPAKCYVRANPQDGTAIQDNTRNDFNELDFSKSKNRHAAISQLQRLLKSIIFILSETTSLGGSTLEDIGITNETGLASDVDLSTTITIKNPDTSQKTREEKWFFVNGIGGELFWLRYACDKLAAKYGREITGIFNRGDSILWDLRTDSSRKAQLVLKDQLKGPLEDNTKAPIVMIAYSQGCLLLRLALEELLEDTDDDIQRVTQELVADTDDAIPKAMQIQKAMKKRLYVFTFGNPSVDWNREKVPNGCSKALSSYICCTEHFANTKDFVAKLGVLREDGVNGQNSGYPGSSTIKNSNEDWAGHLFGAQYSLDACHYDNGPSSRLLACRPGQPIL